MRIDLHVHSKYSYDCSSEPDEIVECAVKAHLDGFLIAEHNSFEASAPWEALMRDTRRNRGLRIVRGVEITTGEGHVIAVGFKDDSWNPWKHSAKHDTASFDYPNMYEILIKIHEIGGVSIIAHPYRGNGKLAVLEEFAKARHFTTAEGINGLCSKDENLLAIERMKSWQRSYTGGSDAHLPDQVGRAYTEFTNPIADMESLVRELKGGAFTGKYGARSA
jgi:hypothetical protein